MARAYTKCLDCEDLLWFDDNSTVPQDVLCSCCNTELTEEGPIGNFTTLTEEEINNLP